MLTANRLYITLFEELDPAKRFACPVVFFLGLALADEVFQKQDTAQHFTLRLMIPTARCRRFRIRDDKRELPIIRMLEGTAIHPTKILTASALHHVLVDLGQRCGYQETITCYAFRRGFANGIEGKSTAPKVRQLMGHLNDGILQSYLSSTIGIDTQNAVRNLPQNTSHVDFSRSIGFSRDIGAPKPHAATFGRSFPKIPEHEIGEMSSEHPTWGRRDIIHRLRKKHFRDEREQYFLAADSSDALEGEEMSEEPPQYYGAHLQPEPSPQFNQVLIFNKAQRLLIENLWSTEITRFSLENAVQPIFELAKPAAYQVFYPHVELPIDGKCGICNATLHERHGHAKLNAHLIACHIKRKKPLGFGFCYDCFQYVPSSQVRKHEEKHMEDPATFCGVLIWRQLVVQPGRCPFCQSNRRPGTRLHRYMDRVELRDHIKWHLDDYPVKCPYLSCGPELAGRSSLAEHLQEIHGIWLG